MADGKIPEEFEVGEPVLVCRWRLSDGKLPAINRHMRALSKRVINSKPLSRQLVAWAKQHIEWTLQEGSYENPDGVLMLIVDDQSRAAMVVGPYEPLEDTTEAALIERARVAEREATNTNVAPETLWVVEDGDLVVGMSVGDKPSGATSLIMDLATTLGMPVERRATLLDEISFSPELASEVFLVSDEHGVVPAADAGGPRSQRFADGWETLLAKTGRKGGSAYTKNMGY